MFYSEGNVNSKTKQTKQTNDNRQKYKMLVHLWRVLRYIYLNFASSSVLILCPIPFQISRRNMKLCLIKESVRGRLGSLGSAIIQHVHMGDCSAPYRPKFTENVVSGDVLVCKYVSAYLAPPEEVGPVILVGGCNDPVRLPCFVTPVSSLGQEAKFPSMIALFVMSTTYY